jgi:hypothetical protein
MRRRRGGVAIPEGGCSVVVNMLKWRLSPVFKEFARPEKWAIKIEFHVALMGAGWIDNFDEAARVARVIVNKSFSEIKDIHDVFVK